VLYGYMPREQFLEMWKGKLCEVIDNYQPDIMWFDSWLDEIPQKYRMEYLAHYFNKAAEWGKEVVVTCKQRDLPHNIAVEDFEKGRTDSLTQYTWLTDDTISRGSWCYTQDLRIKTLAEVLHVLIDIVSKNGQLLLNISPKADGTIPDNQRDVLLGLGAWLDRFGEAIYETRPWLTFGEGPTRLQKGGHFVQMQGGYTSQDIRYTCRGNTVYTIALGWPGEGKEILLTSFAKSNLKGDLQVKGVSMLGCPEDIAFQMRQDGLALTTPGSKVDDLAVVFRIETTGSALFVGTEKAVVLRADKAVLSGEQIKVEERRGRPNIGFWDNPAESIHWLLKVSQPGQYLVRGEFAAGAGPARLQLSVGEQSASFDVPASGGWDIAAFVDIAKMRFEIPGVYHVVLRPADPANHRAVNVWQIQFAPLGYTP